MPKWGLEGVGLVGGKCAMDEEGLLGGGLHGDSWRVENGELSISGVVD